MNLLAIASRSPYPSRPIHIVLATFRNVGGQLAAWRERRRERAALLALDDAALKDLGISRAQAHFEHGKPFWHD
ncbi:MAG TPA: DUF1127 domain-containing protein [Acetobacteraceae bacterium]|nr:DUF1127 domain-containing protein [Acetobacteraceae bacterium]